MQYLYLGVLRYVFGVRYAVSVLVTLSDMTPEKLRVRRIRTVRMRIE